VITALHDDEIAVHQGVDETMLVVDSTRQKPERSCVSGSGVL